MIKIKNCVICEKEFEVTPMTTSKKYCSPQCYAIKYQPKIRYESNRRECLICSNSFEVTWRNHSKKYCSPACIEANNQRIKKAIEIVEKHCIICNCSFLSESFKTTKKYCSEQCRKLGTKKNAEQLNFQRPEVRIDRKEEMERVSKREQIYKRDGYLCYYCGISLFNKHASSITLDHIYPKSLGGPDTASNLVTSCKDCNSKKNATVDVSNIDLIKTCLKDVNKRNETFNISSDLKIYFSHR